MTSGGSAISNHLRTRKAEIAKTWDTLVRAEVPRLATLDRPSLVDHLPEFLEALALWIDGDTATARSGFSALAEGHALQRLGYGIDLVTLTREYMLLRSTILRDLMAVGSGEQTREIMLRLNDGMDAAILEAVRRYSEAHPGIRTNLAATDMGAIAQEVAATVEAKVRLDRSGDLRGIWDPSTVREVLTATIVEVAEHGVAPVTVSMREAGDHESVIVTMKREGPATPSPRLSQRLRELAVSHGARFLMESNGEVTLAIVWPRTPIAEAPERI